MSEILVLAEHRRGELRDITFELIAKGRELSQKIGADLTVVILGHDVREFADRLAVHANNVLLIDDVRCQNYNAEIYQKILANLLSERKPLLTLIGHTSFGLDLAPSLATELDLPLATDCIDVDFEEKRLIAFRQIYGGKVNVKAVLRKSNSYILTLRPATFEVQDIKPLNGEINEIPSPLKEVAWNKEFVEYYESPKGEIDITAMDILIAIGRGVNNVDNIKLVEKLAEALGGALACSRPIADKGWLAADRQVGTSGKTVKPKLYIAVGISGAFQHVSGMKNSDLIIAINKDSKAPIFRVADYGVVENLENFVPILTNSIIECKQ